MSESLPFAMRAMSAAAAKAGLIDGTLSQQQQEAALRKLMENGKAIASEILPHFGEELRKLARANGGLTKALEENFNPALMRAKNTLTELMNTIWEGGMKDALTSIMRSFTDLGQESKGLATIIGTFLGGAIKGLTFPVAILYASIVDLIDIFKELTGTTTEDILSWTKWAANIAGATLGLWGLYRALKMVLGGLKLMGKAKDALTGATAVATGAKSTGSLSGAILSGVGNTVKTSAANAARVAGIPVATLAAMAAAKEYEQSNLSKSGSQMQSIYGATPPVLNIQIETSLDERGLDAKVRNSSWGVMNEVMTEAHMGMMPRN